MKQPVVVMTCFARSGGTVLNKCMASMAGVVMLSEVNPLGGGTSEPDGTNSCTTIQEQARHWYDIALQAPSFKYGIGELALVCDRTDRRLVVRDWSFINFIPHPFNGFTPPYRLLTLESISEDLYVRPFAFVRNAIDVWISRGTPPPDEFFPHYLAYIQAVLAADQPIFRYEDFCAEPGAVLQAICAETGIRYDAAWTNYAAYANVNGDVQIPGGSRGMRQNAIRPLPRRQISCHRIDALHRSAEMMEANRLLGYPTSYYDEASTTSPQSHDELMDTQEQDFSAPDMRGITRRTAADQTYRKAHVAARDKLRQMLLTPRSGGHSTRIGSQSGTRRTQINLPADAMDEKNTGAPDASSGILHSATHGRPPLSFLRARGEMSSPDEDISIEEMRDSLLDALSRGVRAPENLTLLAQSALEVGDFDTARRCLEATLIVDDGHVGARALLMQLATEFDS